MGALVSASQDSRQGPGQHPRLPLQHPALRHLPKPEPPSRSMWGDSSSVSCPHSQALPAPKLGSLTAPGTLHRCPCGASWPDGTWQLPLGAGKGLGMGEVDSELLAQLGSLGQGCCGKGNGPTPPEAKLCGVGLSAVSTPWLHPQVSRG